MADDPTPPAEPIEAPPAELPPAAEPPADPEGLGDAGKRALDAERRRAAEAEKANKDLQKRLNELENANLNEVDRLVKDKSDEARADERTKLMAQVAAAKFEAAGVKPEALAVVDLAKFVNDDGTVNTDAIAQAAKHLAPPAMGAGSADGGPRGGDKPGQLSRAALASMTPEQIVEAKAKGQLDHLLGVTS